MNGVYDEARIALHAIWTRRWLALAVAWGVCVLGWLLVSQIPSRYEAKARVFVQMQSLLPAGLAGAPAEQQRAVDQIRQTLISNVILQKVVRGTDLVKTTSNDRDVADRAAGLASNIKVTAAQDNLFEIVTTAASPKLATDITQKLIDVFVEENLTGDRNRTGQSLRFLDRQLAEQQRQLADAEAKRAEFQNRLGGLPGMGSVADRIGAVRAQINQIDGDLAAAQSSLAAVSAQMASTPASISTPGAAGNAGPARARLSTVQGQLADARARGYTDSHPDVVALNAQLAAAQAAARGEPLVGGTGGGGSPNPVYMSLQSMRADREAQVASLRMRRATLQADLDGLNGRLSLDPQVAAQQGEVERRFQVLKDQYDQLFAQREQLRLRGQAASQADAVAFRIIDPPRAPKTPAAPNRMLLLTGVLLAGLAAGVGAAFALGQLRPTFPTSGKLEAASGLSVIGSIGEVVTRIQAEERRRKLKLFAGGVGGLAAAYALLLGVEILQRGLAA
jgi:polysaccharide chain length determinant protein (PEP-CTERM system associated)